VEKRSGATSEKSPRVGYTLEALSRVCTLERSGSHTSARGLVKRNDGAKEQEGSEGGRGRKAQGSRVRASREVLLYGSSGRRFQIPMQHEESLKFAAPPSRRSYSIFNRFNI